jgi:hypothetical protein
MELDDFKKDAKPVSGNGANGNGAKMDSFIEELKAKDNEIRKKIRVMMIIYVMFFAVYGSTLSLQHGGLKTGYAILVLGFLLILAYFFYKYQKVRKIDYSAPVRLFLEKAEDRYSFMTLLDWIVIIPLLFIIGTGGLIIVWYSFCKYMTAPYLPAGIYLGIIAAAVAVGFWAGTKQWKKESGDLYRKIREMKKDIEL